MSSPSPTAVGVSVVVPTYNEAENLPVILPRIRRVLGRLERPYEIIVVDDASPDGSATVAEAVGDEEELPLRVLRRSGKRSLAAAVLDGGHAATHECVAVLDADLSHDPDDLRLLVESVCTGECDVCVGSRYLAGGELVSWPARRRILSAVGTGLARWLTATSDPLSGFFALRKEVLRQGGAALRPRGFKILFEILGRNPGIRVREVPIRFRDRRRGASKLALRQKVEFVQQWVAILLFRLKGSSRHTRRCAHA